MLVNLWRILLRYKGEIFKCKILIETHDSSKPQNYGHEQYGQSC